MLREFSSYSGSLRNTADDFCFIVDLKQKSDLLFFSIDFGKLKLT